MIYGKLVQTLIIKQYDASGKYLGESARHIYKPVLIWRDVFIGLSIALALLHNIFI